MTAPDKSNARINVRLPQDLKETIEQAASALGQSVSEFTVSTIVRQAREVLREAQATQLSNRDRDTFLAALDDLDQRPNESLQTAARRYKQRMKKSA